MSFDREKPRQFKAISTLNVTFGVPRYITFEESKGVIVKNNQFDFTEKYYYLKGDWMLVLKQHGEGIYLSKRKLG